MDRYINAPMRDEDISVLRAGDYVYITGTVYTARDAAHKRLDEALQKEKNFLLTWKEILYIIWDRRRQGRDGL